MTTREATLNDLTIRQYQQIGADGLTADECATRLGESVLSIRPAVTILKKAGVLVPTAERRENLSGKTARVLRYHAAQG